MTATKRKKKPARERRSLAAQLVQDNKGRLAKVSLNIWYEDDDEVGNTTVSTTAGTGD